MKRFQLCVTGLLFCSPVAALDVPLTYVRQPSRDAQTLKIASIRVGTANPVAPAAHSPLMSIVAGEESARKALVDTTMSTEPVTVAGKRYIPSSSRRPLAVSLKDTASGTAPAGESLFVTVEYFDDLTTDTDVTVWTKGRQPESDVQTPPFTGSNSWKTKVFRLDKEAGTESDDQLYIYASQKGSFRAYGYAHVEKKKTPPSGDWKFPKFHSKQPVYFEVPLGSARQLLVIDQLAPADPMYNVLYFDSNGNRDLTDDTPSTAVVEISQSSAQASFSPVDTEVELQGVKLPFSFSASLYRFRSSMPLRDPIENISFNLQTNCHWAGEATVGAGKYHIVLGDSNCDGSFSDKFSLMQQPGDKLYGRGDAFYFSSGKEVSYGDQHILGDTLVLQDTCYDVQVNLPARKVVLTLNEAPKARLRFATTPEKIQIFTSDSSRALMIENPKQELLVPEGLYRFYTYTVKKQDNEGDQWQLSAQASRSSPEVKVGGKETAVMVFGEPFTPKVEIPEWSRSNVSSGSTGGGLFGIFKSSPAKPKQRVELEFNLQGVSKEVVSDISRTSGTSTKLELSKKDSRRPKEPGYRITKLDGELIADGAFEYG